MANIRVELGPALSDKIGKGEKRIEVRVADGSSIKELLNLLGLPSSEDLLIVKNGKSVDEGCELRDGDEVTLLYALTGG